MKDLIAALTIFLKYGDPYAPTHCEHDVMRVMVSHDVVSAGDLIELEALGFHADGRDFGSFYSYRFGSA